MAWFMGIDIGSVTSKGVITRDGELLAYHVILSGTNHGAAAEKVREALLAKAKLSPEDIAYTVASGCGARNVCFAAERSADMVCSARGINRLFPLVRTVIDVGGQSTQVTRIDEQGRVVNFVVSEKCAAGSGRFLQVIANVLRIDLKDIGPLSLESESPVTFTTGCAVFGESEAITRVCEGVSKEDILAGVHGSLADKVSALISRVGFEEQCALIGGGGLDIGLVKSIEEKLQIHLLVPPQPQIIAALGAALLAKERQEAVGP
jgi:predicted CoA-substrate-specific enzyme activase